LALLLPSRHACDDCVDLAAVDVATVEREQEQFPGYLRPSEPTPLVTLKVLRAASRFDDRLDILEPGILGFFVFEAPGLNILTLLKVEVVSPQKAEQGGLSQVLKQIR